MHERLREMRKALGLTQRQLGDALGIRDSAISKIEKGENALTEQNIRAICREFNVSYEWLSTGRGEMFEDLPETLLSELAQQYHLNPQDIQIIKAYLELTEQERTVIQKYLRAVLGQQ